MHYKKPSGIIPTNDETRITQLHRYEILDSPAETTFDMLAQLAAEIFDTAGAFISFVDQDSVFFKANLNSMPEGRVHRRDSLCALTILEKEPIVFRDTHQIPEFKGSQYLYGAGNNEIRFYAAAPLITAEGLAIGTIGVTDTLPHQQVSEKQLHLLKILSALVMENLAIRLNIKTTAKENDVILHRLAHDIKSPLTSISLYTQLLEAKEMPAEKVFGMAVKIRNSVRSIEAKLNQLFTPPAAKNTDL